MEEEKNTHGGAREGAGRPATGLKRKQVQISMSPEKYERLKAEAEKRGMTFSGFLLQCAEKEISVN